MSAVDPILRGTEDWKCSSFNPVRLSSEAISTSMSRKKTMMTVRFSKLIESFNMIHHVVGPTHLHGGTPELVAPFSDSPLSRIIIDPVGMISDHSLVTAFLTLHHRIDPAPIRQVRSWKMVDLPAFREAIRESALANLSPTSTSSELFEIYDGCLRRIAPEHTACSKVRPLPP